MNHGRLVISVDILSAISVISLQSLLFKTMSSVKLKEARIWLCFLKVSEFEMILDNLRKQNLFLSHAVYQCINLFILDAKYSLYTGKSVSRCCLVIQRFVTQTSSLYKPTRVTVLFANHMSHLQRLWGLTRQKKASYWSRSCLVSDL